MKKPTPPRRVVAALTRLAHRSLTGDPSRRDDFAFQRLEAVLASRSERPTLPRIAKASLAFAFALAVLACLWLGLDLVERTQPITYQVLNGDVVSGYVMGSAETRIRFSDGSDVSLSRGAETKVAELGAHGGRVSLRRGSARFAIAHVAKAAWFVEAGPYTVQVTGTAFDVRWSSAEQVLELALHTGSVTVTGPGGIDVKLRPGQHLLAQGNKVSLSGPRIGSPKPSNDTSPRATGARDVAGAEDVATTALPSAANLAARPPEAVPSRSSWSRQVAQGQFNAVIAEAERRGLGTTLSSASIDELSALADAARYARRSSIANQALLAQRQRFSASPAAREAAFLLGRLAESDGGDALEWYDRYLKESPAGPYSSQALGRKMMLLYKQGGAASARPSASDYLRRFEQGSYASAARKILGEARPLAGP